MYKDRGEYLAITFIFNLENKMSNPTAAIIVIGDEILSGRTKDKNIGWLAEQLFSQGIDLCEARVICRTPDRGPGAPHRRRSRVKEIT